MRLKSRDKWHAQHEKFFHQRKKSSLDTRRRTRICVRQKKQSGDITLDALRKEGGTTGKARARHLEKYPCRSWRARIRAFAGRGTSGTRLIYESGPASSSSYLFVCGLVVTLRAAGPRATYNDIFVREMSHGHFLLIFAHGGTAAEGGRGGSVDAAAGK